MPYIEQARRKRLTHGDILPNTPGDLNYMITSLCLEYLETRPNPSYGVLNDVVGVLECAKQEFYRRVVAGYEDTKIGINGDVYLPARGGHK